MSGYEFRPARTEDAAAVAAFNARLAAAGRGPADSTSFEARGSLRESTSQR